MVCVLLMKKVEKVFLLEARVNASSKVAVTFFGATSEECMFY